MVAHPAESAPPALWSLRAIAALVILGAVACEPTRAPVELKCTSTAHCPATGDMFCDLEKGLCVACSGACPGTETDTTGTASADATTVDSAAGADAAAAASCAGRCGDEFDENASCNCDSACGGYGDCCADFAAVCGGDATSSDATAQADGTVADSDATTVDASPDTGTADTGIADTSITDTALASDATTSDAP